MLGIEISKLPPASSVGVNDQFPIVQGGVTKRADLGNILDAQMGWEFIDSFEDGATITARNQALRQESTGALYRWDGALPKVVPAASTPGTTGGVLVGAWIEVFNPALIPDNAIIYLGTYADLRAYTGDKELVVLKGRNTETDGIGGVFVLESLSGGVDNDGTRINDALGRSWYLQHNGTADFRRFGFVSDFVLTLDDGIDSTGSGTDNSEKLQAIFDDERIAELNGEYGNYWFGVITSDAYKVTCTRPIRINMMGARLYCAIDDPSQPSTSTSLMQFLNTDLVQLEGFEFTQINFDAEYAAAPVNGRGVNPYIFRQTAGAGVLNRGVRVGNYIVHNGQGVAVFASDTDAADRLEGVEIFGSVVGYSVYYGLTMFYSGFNLTAKLILHEYVRAWIINDAQNAEIEIIQIGALSAPTSSSGIINNYGDSDFSCKNIRIRATFDQINGPLRFSAPDAAGSAAVIEDCSLDVYVKDFGSNMSKTIGNVVAIDAFDGDGIYVANGTLTVRNNKIKIRVGQPLHLLNDAFYSQTRTPYNLGNYVDAPRFDVTSIQNERTHYKSPWGATIGHRGNLNSTPLEVSLKKILDRDIGPQPFYVTCYAVITKLASTDHWTQCFSIFGSINSDGTETIRTAAEVWREGSGTYNPTLSFVTSPTGSPLVTVSAGSGQGDNDGRLTLIFVPTSPSVQLF